MPLTKIPTKVKDSMPICLRFADWILKYGTAIADENNLSDL